MPEAEEISRELETAWDFTRTEMQRVYAEFIDPEFDTDNRHFPTTLYGYVMTCFAWIDLLSVYWKGSTDDQTLRMVDFLRHFTTAGHEVAYIAVKMWRHTLMHTARPRELVEESTGVRYGWLLHWADQLPDDQHFLLSTSGPDTKKLSISMLQLTVDISAALATYLEEVRASADIRRRMLAAHEELGSPFRFRGGFEGRARTYKAPGRQWAHDAAYIPSPRMSPSLIVETSLLR